MREVPFTHYSRESGRTCDTAIGMPDALADRADAAIAAGYSFEFTFLGTGDASMTVVEKKNGAHTASVTYPNDPARVAPKFEELLNQYDKFIRRYGAGTP